jgi:hypothetical protein
MVVAVARLIAVRVFEPVVVSFVGVISGVTNGCPVIAMAVGMAVPVLMTVPMRVTVAMGVTVTRTVIVAGTVIIRTAGFNNWAVVGRGRFNVAVRMTVRMIVGMRLRMAVIVGVRGSNGRATATAIGLNQVYKIGGINYSGRVAGRDGLVNCRLETAQVNH